MNDAFPTIGVVAKEDAAARALALELARWLARRGHAVALDEGSLALSGSDAFTRGECPSAA